MGQQNGCPRAAVLLLFFSLRRAPVSASSAPAQRTHGLQIIDPDERLPREAVLCVVQKQTGAGQTVAVCLMMIQGTARVGAPRIQPAVRQLRVRAAAHLHRAHIARIARYLYLIRLQ